jgi:hypothetical protein
MTSERDWLRDSAREGGRGRFVSALSARLSAGLHGSASGNFGRGGCETIDLRPGLPALLIFIEGFPPRESSLRA